MTEVDLAASPQERPLSITSFQGKLDKFERYIAHVTLQETEASTEEKRQAINDNLRYETFCDHVRNLFGTELKSQDLKAIHRKLSTNPDVKIDWSEVFGYFQVENESTEGDEVSVFTASQRKIIGEAAGDKKRRDTIQAVVYSLDFDCYLTASQKGAISLYNGKLRLQNCIDIDESAWMTSVQYLPKLRKVIATTERSIVVWDHRAKGKNQLNIHVIKPLEHSPQCMCLVPMEDEHCDALLIGDDAGYINLVRLTHNDFVVKANKDQKRVMKYHVIDPSTLTIPVVRRKFHHDWVLQVQYLPDLKCFASCSPGERQSLVIGNMKRLHDTQPVSALPIPRGVNAFCYSEKSNIFATGGVDKTIRLWHPNILSRPTGKMVGHLFTIVDIVMNDKDQHIISLSTARVFRVWDIHTLACLQVFTDSDERSGDRRISTMLFDGRHDRLITGSNTVDLWPMTRTVQDTMSVPHTHDHALSLIVLNGSASQIITICTESIIKVWEVETGRQMYQIMDAHGPNIEVTSAAVDTTGTRMATGGYDGSLKIWEFSSGQEIKSLFPEEAKEDDQSVLALSYINVEDNPAGEEGSAKEDTAENPASAVLLTTQEESIVEKKPQKILAVGWNNKLKVFMDDEDSTDILKVCEFNGMYEWPLPPPPSSPTFSVIDAEDGNRLNNVDVEPRKENVLERNEMSVFALLRHRDVTPTLVTGCANGNLLLWDYNKASVTAVFDLAKAELASSYDSQHHRSKEKYPHRINGIVMLCHKIFKPDPEEVKRRIRLKRKKMLEEEGLDDDSEQDKSEKAENNDVDATANDDDDPSKEVDLDIQSAGGDTSDEDEEEDGSHHGIDYSSIDKEAIKMIEVLYPLVIASCHQDTDIRLWSYEGELLSTVTPTTQVVSPLTAICCDEFAHQLIAADAKGYITVWEVSEFLEKSTASMALQSRQELIKQLVCWRAHLMKVTSLVYVNSSRVLVSASTDGSVRVWYPQRGHYVGYFGQHRMWHVDPNPSLPSSPVLPYDINEGPVNPVNVRSGRRKPQTKKYEYPLVFDADRWKPFRRSAYTREALQRNNQPQTNLNIIEIRNKKFFSALVKPKADKSGLESDKPVDSDTGAIFHHLPVYRLKTPPVQPKPTSYISEWGEEHSDAPKVGNPVSKGGASKLPASSSQGQKSFRTSRPMVRKPTNSTAGQVVAKKR